MSEGATDEKLAIPNQVFVGGMTPETSVEQLTKHFASLKLTPTGAPTFFLNPAGASKGCALVPFGSPEDAKAAVDALENSELAGQKLRARADRGPRRPRRREQVNQDNSYVYVGNLDPAVTQQELEDLFAPYGKPQYVNISRKRRSDNALGWATVQLASEEVAQKAREALNGQKFKENDLAVEPLRSLPRKARARKEREPRDADTPALEDAEPEVPVDPSIVWVGNLAWTTTEDALQKLFAQQGEVKEVVVTRQKRSNQSRGWGTVTFATPEAAAAAVAALNGTLLDERNIEVQIRRGPRRRRRAPREPRGTGGEETNTAGGEGRPRRNRRQRRPRGQNTDEEQQPRTNQRPRRQEGKQQTSEPAATEETKPRRRQRARRPRNDSQRNEENTTAASTDQNADNEPKNPRRRRRRQRKPEDGAEGDANEEQQERRPRAERKEPEKIVVDHPDRHIYVRNLAWEVTGDDLKAFFSQSGNVVNATVTLNAKGTSRGWGTVEMGSAAEATKALGLDKQKFKERQIIVRADKRVSGRE